MTVRSDYSLSRARYAHFLFTVVGSEGRGAGNSGEDITVLSALARVGIDPWQEAARLAVLPRAEAAESLAATFLNLPDTRWAAGDATGAARGIVSMLPEPSRRAPDPLGPRAFLTWGLWAAVGLALAFIAVKYMVTAIGPLTGT